MTLKSVFFSIVLTLGIACSSGGGNPVADNQPGTDADVQVTDIAADVQQDVPVTKCHSDKDCEGLNAGQCMHMACNLNTGMCQGMPDSTKNGQVCNDNDSCTQKDQCKDGVCQGTPKKCPDTGNTCTTMQCVSSTGECVEQNVADDTVCDDGNQCTLDDACKSGVCKGGKANHVCNCDIDDDCAKFNLNLCRGPVSCVAHHCKQDTNKAVECENPHQQCKKNVCNSKTGKCELKNLGNGVVCDDNDKCTLDDVCKAGVCTGTQKPCDDKNVCTDDTCDSTTGKCIFTPVPRRACDDGDVCTAQAGDKCDANGKCVGGAPVYNCCHNDQDCDDKYGCTADTCNQATHQCVYALPICDQAISQCQGLGCLGDQCKTTSNSRLNRLMVFSFTQAMPKGVSVDPVGAAGFANGKLEVTKGDKVTVHLPLLPGMGMQGMLRVSASADVTVEGAQKLGYENGAGFWGIGNEAAHSVKIDVPKGAALSRVEYYGLSTDASCISGQKLTSGKLGDHIIAIGAPQGVLVMWVVKGTTKNSLMYRVFDWGGQPVAGDAGKIVEGIFTPSFRIAGYWTGKKWSLVYGGFDADSNGSPTLFSLTIDMLGNAGQPKAFGLDYSQQTPFTRDTSLGVITCYSYKAKQGSADFDVKCRIGDGQYFDLAQYNQGDQAFPRACIMNDQVVTTWLDYDSTVKARIFNKNGKAQGGQDTLSTSAKVSSYNLFCDTTGFDMVALLTDNTVRVYRYVYADSKFQLVGKAVTLFGSTMSMSAITTQGRIMVSGFKCQGSTCKLAFHSIKTDDLTDNLAWEDEGGFSKNNKPVSITGWENGFVGVIVSDQSSLTYLPEGVKCNKGWLYSGRVCVGDLYY